MCEVQINVPKNDLDTEISPVWQSADVLSIHDRRQYSLKIIFFGIDTKQFYILVSSYNIKTYN